MSSPFNDLRSVLSQLPVGDLCAAKNIMKNFGEGGGLSEDGLLALKCWLATWQGAEMPVMDEAHICVLASSYVGNESSPVTDFISAASKGLAPVNRLCVDRGVGLRVLELAPEVPYDAAEPWKEADCMAAVAFGMEATASGGHLLGLSDFAPGNIYSALAIILSLAPDGFENALERIIHSCSETDESFAPIFSMLRTRQAPSLNGVSDPLEVLRHFGGREVAASVGAIVAARSRRLPVVIDGWSALAAIAVLEAEVPGSTAHVKVASCPDSVAISAALSIGKEPLVGPVISSGAGCGNAVSVAVLKAAIDL